MIRLGSPSSDPVGIALESTCKGRNRRISLRAWHPSANINAHHWTIEEFARALGLTIPPRAGKTRGKSRI